MTYGARLFLIIFSFQFLIANPIPIEYPIIPKIDCKDLNGNGHPDFIAVSRSSAPRSLYHIEFKDSNIEFLWEYSMPENIQGYFADMIIEDFDNNGVIELIAVAYQDENQKIFYVFPVNSNGFDGDSPQILGISNSSVSITQPYKLYPMNRKLEGFRHFLLTQGSPSRHIIICRYMNGEIISVGSYGNKFLSKSMGPLELSLGNFDEDNIEDVFILSNGSNPEGYIIFSDGSEKNAGLNNYPRIQLLYNKGVDLNFDGIDDLLMVNRDGDLMSNIWGTESLSLSEDKIQDILISLDNGLIHLNSISQTGTIGHYTIDPLTRKILTSEYDSPESWKSNISQIHSLITNNYILLVNYEKSPELWAFPLTLEKMVEAPVLSKLQKISSKIPDYVINTGDIFIHPLVNDTTKSFLHFTEEYLPFGMEFNLDDIQLEWVPTYSQLGFHEFSFILRFREKEGLEMEIDNKKKFVSQKENITEEKNSFLIYVNDPVKFNNEEKNITIVNTKSFEWIIPINDNNVDALLEVQKILGVEDAGFQLLEQVNNKKLLDSMIIKSEQLIESITIDSQFQNISNAKLNPHLSKFFWTPNTNDENFQFSLAVSDGYGSDTLEFSATIHPEIDLSMNQTEFTVTVNRNFSNSLELKQIPLSEKYFYILLNAPENMRVTDSGIINWIPLATQVDNYLFNVRVTDNIAFSNLQYNIYVNAPPVISSRPSDIFVINLGDSLFFPLESFDLNRDATLIWKLLSGPIDMILNSEGVLIWKGIKLDHHPYKIQLSDGIDSVQWNGSIYVNVPPKFHSDPITYISENELYEYQLDAIDNNMINPMDPYTNNNVIYKLEVGPMGMEIVYQNVLRWEPDENTSGEFPVSIIATDGIEDTPQNFQLLINSSPTITSMDNFSVEIGDTLSVYVQANDSNLGDSLSYFIDVLLPGMTLDINSGLLTWIPTISDIGKHSFNLQVKDGHNASGTNHKLQIFSYLPPIFTGDLLTEAFVGLEYAAFLTGEDMFGSKLRDEETIFIEMTTINNYTLSEYGRHFLWTPNEMDLGEHEIHVRIIDENGFDKLHTHSISVFKNPCFQCDGAPESSPIDTTAN